MDEKQRNLANVQIAKFCAGSLWEIIPSALRYDDIHLLVYRSLSGDSSVLSSFFIFK